VHRCRRARAAEPLVGGGAWTSESTGNLGCSLGEGVQAPESTSSLAAHRWRSMLTVINSYYKPSIKHEKEYKCNHLHRIGTQLT
jgi:hypothetical protein